jgi:hypothetical protein
MYIMLKVTLCTVHSVLYCQKQRDIKSNDIHDFEPSTKHLIFSYATEVENQLFKDLLNGFVVLSSHLKNMYLDVSQTF